MEHRKYFKNLYEETPSDQSKGVTPPPIQKPYSKDAILVDLVSPDNFKMRHTLLVDAINNRESRRQYLDTPLTLEELSFLLWCTQGVKEIVRNGLVTLRTVPSGGALHPYETYIVIDCVVGIESGLYRYLANEQKLFPLDTSSKNLSKKIGEISNRQAFVGTAPVVFIWTARPYRSEWRYGIDVIKDVLMGVGHICQNFT